MIDYIIYTLTNPIDGNIFYVGRTINMKNRFGTHCSERTQYENSKKWATIDFIKSNGMLPIIEEIDRITCKCLEDEDLADELEIYWMFQLKTWGFELVNRVGLRTRGGDHRRLGKRLKSKRFILPEYPTKDEIREFWKQRYA